MKWIQKLKIKKGVLHRELGISEGNKIPMQLLNRIISARAGQTIVNPTKIGKKKILVTRGIERRAILARNLKNISRKK